MERVVQKVMVPQRVTKTVPVTEIRLVPRIVTRRIPIDIYGNPISIPSLEPQASETQAAEAQTSENQTPKVQTLNAPASSPSDQSAGKPAAGPDASGAAGQGTTVTSKKPALTESGDLPAPTALAAPRVPTEILPENAAAETGASASSKTELSIGSPEPEAKPEAKPDAQPADTKTEKSGKIRVTGEE
jgi:hypothetical protein